MYKRLPLGCLLRDESTNSFFIVIKADLHPTNNMVYYLCCIYDPRDEDPKAPFKYYFTVDEERIEKYTVLNTDVKMRSDGTLFHVLATVNVKEIYSLTNNTEFMLRFLTAVKNFSKDKRTYKVDGVDTLESRVILERKTSFLEKIFLRANSLGYSITWSELLNEFTPCIPDNLNERDFVKSVSKNCYYCTTED